MTGSESVRGNEGETRDARTAHVPAVASSHARADSWVDRLASDPESEAWLEYESLLLFQEDYPDAFHEAVSAELVACTLGQRVRPELRVDRVGRFAHLINQGVLRLQHTARALMDELAAYRWPTRGV